MGPIIVGIILILSGTFLVALGAHELGEPAIIQKYKVAEKFLQESIERNQRSIDRLNKVTEKYGK